MNRLLRIVLPMFLLVSASASATRSTAADVQAPGQTVQARLIADSQSVVPGQSVQIGVELVIPAGWHVYYEEPGDSGKPTSIEWTLPEKFTASDLRWQRPHKFEEDGLKTYGYENSTFIVTTVTVPDTVKPGETVTIKAKVSWLACKETCVPGSAEVTLTLPVAGSTQTSGQEALFASAVFHGPPESLISVATPPAGETSFSLVGFLLQLLFAFIGGMILNLMPCVLPVVSLKVLSFARQGGDDRAQVIRLGVSYAAGTIATFLLMALVILGLRAFGSTVGWGFQFQQPWFVLAMCCVMTMMAASLFGAFDIVVSGSQTIGNLAGKKGVTGAFFTGVLATLLSTPCTAPFLGSAIGFALTQPAIVVLAIFTSVGLGLSAPYLLLTWKPVWLKFVPKPGDWMVRFKELMGFPMLLTAAWLLSVLVKQAGAKALFPALVLMITVTFCAWLTMHVVNPMTSTRRTWTLRALAALIFGAAAWWALPTVLAPKEADTTSVTRVVDGVTWEKFDETAMQKHLQNGKIVLVDFTADWCLTCKLNEKILTSSDVAAAMRANNVIVMQGDWTNGDPAITAWLNRFGRSGVPFYAVLSPHRPKSPQVLPEILTPSSLIESIEKAAKH